MTTKGAVIRPALVTPELCKQNPEALFLFGDNLARFGRKGQSIIRYEPNALGIVTKRYPSMQPDSFLTDDDREVVLPLLDEAFKKASSHLRKVGDVWIPEGGLGTGLARLPSRAPLIFAHIEGWIDKLIRLTR